MFPIASAPSTSRRGGSSASSAATIAAVYYGAKASMAFGRDVRAAIFHQVGTFSAREVGRFGAPSLITRITNDVQQMQLLGVRYYMAFSDKAVGYARAHPDLTEVASSGPWVVFEVANSEMVVGLPNEPAVLSDVDPAIDGL